MKIKMPFSSAKRLGLSIKGYVFFKEKKVPQPVIEKIKTIKKYHRGIKKEHIKLKDEGRIVKLLLN